MLIIFAAMAATFLAVGLFAKDWIYYLLIACFVFADSSFHFGHLFVYKIYALKSLYTGK